MPIKLVSGELLAHTFVGMPARAYKSTVTIQLVGTYGVELGAAKFIRPLTIRAPPIMPSKPAAPQQ